MYINKFLYYPAKIITGIGNFFWGNLTLILLSGVLIPRLRNGFDDIGSVTGAFCVIWAGHYFLGIFLQKAKFYNTFFENDNDGYIQSRVIGKAIGKPEKRVIMDLQMLIKLHLLKYCSLQYDTYNTVVLQNPNLKYVTHYIPSTAEKICPHCGGKNIVRTGFVSACEYCGGSLE